MSGERGFLTDTDREFLRGDKEYDGDNAKQMRYQRRRAIRERTRKAFDDFGILFEILDENERNKIFDPPKDEVSELMTGVMKTISFLYLSLEGEAGSNIAMSRSFTLPFREALESGVRNGEFVRQPQDPFRGVIDVDADITVNVKTERGPTSRERAIEELAKHEGRTLSDQELRALLTQAVRETLSDEGWPMAGVEAELPEDHPEPPDTSLYGLAEEIEQKAKELNEESDEEG